VIGGEIVELSAFGLGEVGMFGGWDVGTLGRWDVWTFGCLDVGMLGFMDIGVEVRSKEQLILYSDGNGRFNIFILNYV
jgi:hypothetical protein